MSDRLSPQAEAAYRRAVSAYQQGSYDEAHRWAREALANDPAHVAAAALLRRLGGRDAGPQVVSTDPTVLIDGGRGSAMAESQDPTIIVPRKTQQPTPKRHPGPPSPPPGPSARRASEPTVIVPQSSGRSAALGYATLNRGTGSVWQRLLGGGGRRDGGFSTGVSTSRGRGILIIGGAIALAALSVWGTIAAYRVVSRVGERLTIEAAEGGRIIGDGLRCGAGSTRCSKAVPTGERVELTAEAESGYEFGGFTGDCETNRGMLLMDGPKTCGARFEKLNRPPPGAKFTLSIEKPKGGTVVFRDVITCGSLGADCSEEIQANEFVTLRFQADDGYAFQRFSGECEGQEFVMSSARTCGAVFIADPLNRPPPPKPVDVDRPGRGPGSRVKVDPPPDSKEKTSAEQKPPPPPTPDKPVNPPVPSTSVLPPAVSPTPAPQTPPPAQPDDMEVHAKKEIKQRVDEYCNALETLKPEEVQRVFPRADVRILKRQFDGYKSLDCTLSADLQYDRFDIGTAASAAASAQVKVGMKQAIEMHGGGAPKPQEMTVTILLSRVDLRSRWKIDDVIYAAAKK